MSATRRAPAELSFDTGPMHRGNHQGQGDSPWAQEALQMWQGLLRYGDDMGNNTENVSQLWYTNESAKFFSNRPRIPQS